MTVVWPRVVVEEQEQRNRWRDEGTDSQSGNALTVDVGGIPNVSTVDGWEQGLKEELF